MGKKDDFDGDMFPMDDFDMDDLMGGKIKPPKGVKAVFAGIKNFGKWWVKGTIEDYLPETKKLFEFPIEVGREFGSQIRDLNDKYQFKATAQKALGEVKKTVKEEVSNFSAQIKDGSFFTVSADDRMMAAMMGDSDEMFGGGGGGDSSPSEQSAERRSKRTAKAIIDSNVRTVKAIAATSEASQKQSARQFEVKAKMDSSMHSQMYGVVSNIAQNIGTLVKQNNMLIKATVESSSKSLKLMSAQAKLLQDIRSAQWKQIGKKKKVDVTNPRTKITARDIYGYDGSDFDQSNYIAFLTQNLKDAIMENTIISSISMATGMMDKDMIKMSGGYMGMITTSIGDFLRKKINTSLFGAGTRAMAMRINKLSKNVLPNLNRHLSKIARSGIKTRDKWTGNNKIDSAINKLLSEYGGSDFAQAIADKLRVRDESYSAVKTRNFEGSAVHPFDNVAHKALTEVIPGLLSKIYAATSGDSELVFDYNRNKFISGKAVYEKAREAETNLKRDLAGNHTAKQVKRQIQSNIKKSFIGKGTADDVSEDTRDYMNKIIDGLDMVVHNYLFYGYNQDDLKDIRTWLSKKADEAGNFPSPPYKFEYLTKDVLGGFKFKRDVVRHFIDNIKDIEKKNPQLSMEFHNAQNVYKSNMTRSMHDIQDDIESSTNGSHIYLTAMEDGASKADSMDNISREIEKVKARINERKERMKNGGDGKIKFVKALEEQAHEKDVELLRDLQYKIRNYYTSDSASIVGVNDYNDSDFTTRRIMDIDTTSGLIKNIHDMILQGVIVYPNKMSDEVSKAYERRRTAYKDAKSIIENKDIARQQEKDYEKTMFDDINEAAKLDDVVDDLEVDSDGFLYNWFRKKGTVRGKVVGALDRFTESLGEKVLSTTLKATGYDPDSAAYKEQMANNYKIKKEENKIEKLKEFAKDMGVSEERIEKLTLKANGAKIKAQDILNIVGDKSEGVKNSVMKKADELGIISKASTGVDKSLGFVKQSTNSISSKLGFGKIFKDKSEETTKIAEEAVAKGEDEKKEVIGKIVQDAQKNGLSPESDEVQSAVNKAESEIDNQTIAAAEAKGGEVAAEKTRIEIKKAKILRRHKHRLTGALAAIQQYGVGSIGKAISLFGEGWVGLGGKLRKGGKWLREKSSNFGLPGKIIGKTAGAMLSGIGLATQGYGQIVRGVGGLTTGVGVAASYVTRGIGHAIGFTLGGAWDIATYPVRKVYEIAKRVKAGKASKKEKQLIENAKNSDNPEIKQAVVEAEQETVVKDAKSALDGTSTGDQPKRKRGRPRKNPLPDPDQPKRKRGRPRKNPLPEEVKEEESKHGFISKAKDMFSNIGSFFGFGSKERDGSREQQERLQKEKAKEDQEKANSENMRVMAEQMTNPKYGGIFVRFSKEGLNEQTEAMEEAGLGGGDGGGGAIGALGAGATALVGAKVKGKIGARIGKKLGATKVGKALGYSAETGKRTGFIKRGLTAAKNKVFKSSAKSATKEAVKSTAKNAVKTAAKEGVKGAAKNAGKFSKFLGWISKFFNNKKIAAKLAGKGPKLLAFFTKMFKGLTKANTGSVVSGVLKRIIPLLGARVAAFLGTVSSGVGIAINVASFLAGFVKGAANTKRIFNLGNGIEIPGTMRLACGIAEGLNGLLLGIPGILVQLGGPLFGKNWSGVAHMIYDIIGSDAMKAGMSAYHSYNAKRARIYGISDPQKLINFENGSDRGIFQKIGGWFGSAFGVADKQKAEALGFKSVRAFEEWKERKYQPLEKLREHVAEPYGRLKDLEALEPTDPENTKKYREAFLREAGSFIKSRNLGWLTDKTTEEEVVAKLGKGRSGFTKFARGLGSMFGITQLVDKSRASKSAKDYMDEKNGIKVKDTPKDVQIVDAEGNVTTLNSTLDQEIEKYRQLATDKGIKDKRFDKVKSILSTVKDMGTVKEALEATLNASDEKSAIEAARKVIESRKKNGTASTNPEESVSTTTDTVTSTTMSNTTTGAAASSDSNVAPSTSSAPVTTSGTLKGSPAKTATLKLSSEMSDAFKWQKEQYIEQVRHDKITETAFVSMVRLLTMLVNQNGGNANAVLDELSRQIASS